MRKNLRRTGIITFLFLLLMIATGCNQEQSRTMLKVTQDFVPITDIVEGRPNIYVIVKSMTSSYWEVVLEGTKQAGIDHECNIYAAGSTLETEWELQEAYIELAIKSGADAIILGPDNSEMLAPAVEMVHDKGIPIIIVDTIVNSDDYDVCYLTDNLLAGENAAKEMLRILKEQGHSETEEVNVGIELRAKASQTINERLAGFSQYWTKYAPDTWNIIDELKCNDGDEVLATKLSEEFLEQYPDIDGVFGTDNASTMGFSSALLKFNRQDIVMVGFDYSPEVAQIIEDGNFNVSLMLQSQYDMGYKGVESALLLIDGKTVELKFVDTGSVVLNKDSLNSEEILEILQGNRGK